MAVFLLASATAFFGLVGIFMWAGLARITGRHSRFDGIAETLVRAQGAAVYPPSLRGDPLPPVIEEVEDSRAARAERDTPADEKKSPSR